MGGQENRPRSARNGAVSFSELANLNPQQFWRERVDQELRWLLDCHDQWQAAVYRSETILSLWPQSDLAGAHLVPEDIMAPHRGLKAIRRYVAGVCALPAFTGRYGEVEIKVDGRVNRSRTTKTLAACCSGRTGQGTGCPRPGDGCLKSLARANRLDNRGVPVCRYPSAAPCHGRLSGGR